MLLTTVKECHQFIKYMNNNNKHVEVEIILNLFHIIHSIIK